MSDDCMEWRFSIGHKGTSHTDADAAYTTILIRKEDFCHENIFKAAHLRLTFGTLKEEQFLT